MGLGRSRSRAGTGLYAIIAFRASVRQPEPPRVAGAAGVAGCCWELPEVAESCRSRRGPPDGCYREPPDAAESYRSRGDLPGAAGSCRKPPGAAKCCRKSPRAVGSCREPPEDDGSCRMLPEPLGIAGAAESYRGRRELPEAAGSRQVLPGVAESSRSRGEPPRAAGSCRELPEPPVVTGCYRKPPSVAGSRRELPEAAGNCRGHRELPDVAECCRSSRVLPEPPIAAKCRRPRHVSLEYGGRRQGREIRKLKQKYCFI